MNGTIALMGIPGAGKTTLAKWIASRSDSFCIVSRDKVRSAMFAQCLYTEREKDAAFEACLVAHDIIMGQGKSILTDGMCLSSVGDLEKVEIVSQKLGLLTLPVYCHCDIDVAMARVAADVAQSTHLAEDRTPELVANVAARFRPIPERAIVVDLTHNVAEAGAQIIEQWRDRGGSA